MAIQMDDSKMEYRKLGWAGMKVSVFSLGSWHTFGQTVDDETTTEIMKRACENGINFFDGAEVYGYGEAELAMARAIKKLGLDHEYYIISSKVCTSTHFSPTTRTGVHRKRIRDACDAALKRLEVDYLDMFFCHRPQPDMDLRELLVAMNDLIRQGKILYWGTSEFSAADLIQLFDLAREYKLDPPAMEQTGYNMLGRERVDGELPPVFQRCDLGITSYVPLCSGMLTGKYNDGVPAGSRMDQHDFLQGQLTRERIEKVRKISGIADQLGVPVHRLALAWILKNPRITTAILGASKPEYIDDNVQAVALASQLDEDLMQRLEEIIALPAAP
jgi:voltage-dependent potassium channel beta subunit